jgi:hypothetical protein
MRRGTAAMLLVFGTVAFIAGLATCSSRRSSTPSGSRPGLPNIVGRIRD